MRDGRIHTKNLRPNLIQITFPVILTIDVLKHWYNSITLSLFNCGNLKKVKKNPFLTFAAIFKCDGRTNILWLTYFCEYTALTTGLKGQEIDIIQIIIK